MDIKQYAARYAKWHSIWERKAVPIFYKALVTSVTPVIRTLDPSTLLRSPWIEAYQKVYITIGMQAAQMEYNFLKRDSVKAAPVNFNSEGWRKALLAAGHDIGFEFVNDLSETTLNQIREAILFAQANDYTNSQMAEAIYNYTLGQVGRRRALVISRTESTTASNIAKNEASKTYFKEIGESNGYKMWVSRADAAVRHSHVAENETIVPFDDMFKLTNGEGMRPGDPALPAEERVNCRCTFVAMSERLYRRRIAEGRGKEES